MSHTLDLYDPAFPHGTVDGYRQGCHGSACGSLIACRDVYRRYQGDYSFRKLIDSGMTAAEIIARDEAERAGAVERDKAAARAERAQAAALARPKRTRAAREPRPPRELAVDRLGPEIERLHGEGKVDREVATILGISVAYASALRRNLGLLPHGRPRKPRVAREVKPRHDRRVDVAQLHDEGLNDKEVGAELGIAPLYAGALRRELGLPANIKRRARKERPPRAPRRDRRPDVAAAHADGLSDRQIAERIGIGYTEVGRLRRELGLTSNRPPAWRRAPEKLQPHGTNACYARGCRCADCHQAQREYYREYNRRKRAQGIAAEHHGTPYGYQQGCRGRSACPAETSCTDAVLEEDRRRRREAGIPEASPRVPAEPVRAHVRALIDSGHSVLGIAEEAGVSKSGLKTLLYGRSGARKGELPAHIETEKAERLMSLGRTA